MQINVCEKYLDIYNDMYGIDCRQRTHRKVSRRVLSKFRIYIYDPSLIMFDFILTCPFCNTSQRSMKDNVENQKPRNRIFSGEKIVSRFIEGSIFRLFSISNTSSLYIVLFRRGTEVFPWGGASLDSQQSNYAIKSRRRIRREELKKKKKRAPKQNSRVRPRVQLSRRLFPLPRTPLFLQLGISSVPNNLIVRGVTQNSVKRWWYSKRAVDSKEKEKRRYAGTRRRVDCPPPSRSLVENGISGEISIIRGRLEPSCRQNDWKNHEDSQVGPKSDS